MAAAIDATDNEEEFDDYSLPLEVELGQPSSLTFAPWHKPRKQFVRKQQWVHHAHGIAEKLRQMGSWNDGAPLKYLTLPGPDLIDVKLIAEVCATEDIDLHYTGFCYASETDADRLRKNVSQFSMELGNRIRQGSEIHHSRIEEVTVNRSSAKTLMERGGPYDIINIDACSPIAKNGQNQTGRLVDAIRRIVESQLGSSRRPWMLYLTTPLQTDSISGQSLESLHTQISENARNDAAFAAELSNSFEDGEDLTAYLDRVSAVNGLAFVQMATLGISKWFVHLASQANYAVKKLEGYCYSIFGAEPFEPNMISVCYLFLPTVIEIIDQTGLTPNALQAHQHSGVSDHLRALQRSFDMKNLDELMAADKELCGTMIEETKELLRQVGYDVDHPTTGYASWLANTPMQARQRAGE